MAKAKRKVREKRYSREEVAAMIAEARDQALNPPMAAKPQLNRKQLGEHVAGLISNERNETHGDPHIQFECAQRLKAIVIEYMIRTEHRSQLDNTENESLNMILTKISRLTCGSNLQDAWLDIAGYALIAAEKAEKPL